MNIEIKTLGFLSKYNDVNISIDQKQAYIKLIAKTYIDKILIGHQWFDLQRPALHHEPIPMKSEIEYVNNIESSEPPTTTEQDEILLQQHELGFNCSQGIGELIYCYTI